MLKRPARGPCHNLQRPALELFWRVPTDSVGFVVVRTVERPYDQKFFLAIPQLEVLPLGQPHALASEYVEIFVTFKFTFLTSFRIPHSVA